MNTLQDLVKDKEDLEQKIRSLTNEFLCKYKQQIIIDGVIHISRETGCLVVDLKTQIY